jgi:hypothetical protein
MPKKVNNCGFGINFDKLGSNVYSGTAEFGKDYTIITTIITLIICVFFIIGGIMLLLRKPQFTKQTTMTIMLVTPSVDSSGKVVNTYYGKVKDCGDKEMQLIGAEWSIFKVDDTTPVFIKPDGSCQEAHLHSDNFKPMGWLFIVLALIVGGFSLINLFFVKKYKGIAAVEGVAAGINIFRR